ncbi:MAG TPA: response regulator transcription factor [Polyangiales bacterium]
MIRVLIADDQTLFREGLRAVLGAHGIDVVGEAGDGQEALDLARQLLPDVVLMDLRMPRLSGVEATRRLQQLPRPPRVIALTTFEDDEALFAVLRAGARGYLLKDSPAAQLVEAISAATRGESLLTPAITAKLIDAFAHTDAPSSRDVAEDLGLSERELSVLAQLAQGAANKEIGARLRIAEGTVKNHVTNIFTKLGVSDRTQAALKARALGLL